jgi:Putative peptidoglycan binding domain
MAAPVTRDDDLARAPHDDVDDFGDLEPRRRVWPAVVVAGLLAVAVGGTYLVTRSTRGSSTTATTVKRSVSLFTVSRRNLVETASYDGTVQYADQRPLAAGSAGTLTRVAAAGSTVGRGGVLFAVDTQPTVLLYGRFPMYRTLQSGVSDGSDIAELKANLRKLGYAPASMTIDKTWDSDLTTGVENWETALGLTADGVVPASRVVFAPSAVRIADAGDVGDSVSPSSTPVTTSSVERDATVSLDVSDASIVGVGDRVTVTLPSGASVRGRVTEIGTVASSSSSSTTGSNQGGATNQNGASSSTSSATVDVTIALANDRGLGTLAESPVTVAFAQERAANVLAVPTTALLTLADGTFAVEVSDGGGRTHLVRVTPGLFAAGGYVGIQGAVNAGDRIVVPQ